MKAVPSSTSLYQHQYMFSSINITSPNQALSCETSPSSASPHPAPVHWPAWRHHTTKILRRCEDYSVINESVSAPVHAFIYQRNVTKPTVSIVKRARDQRVYIQHQYMLSSINITLPNQVSLLALVKALPSSTGLYQHQYMFSSINITTPNQVSLDALVKALPSS